MAKQIVGLDIETYDPLLKASGWSWKYGQGYILNTALYYEDTDEVKVIAGINNENCPFDLIDRQCDNKEIIDLLTDSNVCIVGANLQYDIGWLLYEYKMSTYDVKCSFVDVLQAEAILDEFGMHSLESVSWKYLKYGKTKDRIEDWVKEHISAKGDFRGYLKDAPWDMLVEYVSGDAKNPVKVWRKQLTLLKEQDLCKRAKLEFDCTLPTLEMTRTGMPINIEQKKKNLALLSEAIEKLHKEFINKYNLPNFRVTATRDVANFCDLRNIPYNYQITLTGMNGAKFRNGDETDRAYHKAKQLVSNFRLVKGKPVAFVPKEMQERTCELLTEEGLMFNTSPKMDKKFFDSKRESYPEIDLIANWKLAIGIQSKILGEKYDRFLTKNFKGEACIKPQFKITDTISFRYSSNMPNCIAGNMRVLTPRGWKRIDRLTIGEEIYNGNGDITTVRNIWNKGIQNCLLTVSANGYRIVTTPEHKVWSGTEEKEIKDCEQIGIIDRKASGKNVQVYAYKGTDSRCATDKQRHCNRSAETKLDCLGVYRIEKTAQNQNSRSLHQSRRRTCLCQRVFILGATLFQRPLSKIQGLFEQRKKLFEKVSYRGAEKRTAQSESSTGKVCAEWSNRKTLRKLQGHLFGFRRICFCAYYSYRRRNEQSKTKQKSFCRGFGLGRTPVANEYGRTSYRHKPLEQQLRQLGSMYEASTCRVTQTATKAQEVYDIEVASEDHSFICEGFRVFNCQQVPSKNSFTLHDDFGNEVVYSFPKLTRALFTASKGCVFGKIDYGQIEYRLICNIACGKSGEEVREQYRKNPHLDFHQYVVDLTGLSRKYAKNMSFGVSFGMGLPSMAENFGWTMEKAEEISEAYHNHMPFVAPTLALVGDVAKERGYIKTVYGSHARLHDKKKAYTMLNRYTQGSGAECLKASIVQAYKEGIWKALKVANTVHDELNMPYLEPTEEKMIALYRMAEIMRTSIPTLKIPLEASPELGDNWASTKEVSEWIELKDKNDEAWLRTSDNLKKAVLICERLLKEGKVSV